MKSWKVVLNLTFEVVACVLNLTFDDNCEVYQTKVYSYCNETHNDANLLAHLQWSKHMKSFTFDWNQTIKTFPWSVFVGIIRSTWNIWMWNISRLNQNLFVIRMLFLLSTWMQTKTTRRVCQHGGLSWTKAAHAFCIGFFCVDIPNAVVSVSA